MRTQKETIPYSLKNKVFQRDGKVCRYCGDREGPFQLDHVYPESRGGETSFSNLAVTCKRCNVRKHAKIGIWPKPVGYFDEIETRLRNETKRSNILNSAISSAINLAMIMTIIGAIMVLPAVIPQLEFLRNSEIHVSGAIIFALGIGIEISATAIERKL